MHELLRALSAQERMDCLERFLEFWYGPRQASFGVPPAELKAKTVPMPLRRLHAFAGRWPHPVHDYIPNIVSGADHLIAWDQLIPRADGKLAFLGEYQGDWQVATLASGDDPPVWVSNVEIYRDNVGGFASDDGMLSPSLSRYLVSYVLESTLQTFMVNVQTSRTADLLRALDRPGDVVLMWQNRDDMRFRDRYFLVRNALLVGESEQTITLKKQITVAWNPRLGKAALAGLEELLSVT